VENIGISILQPDSEVDSNIGIFLFELNYEVVWGVQSLLLLVQLDR
jgi:hypothetical protein